MARVMEGRHRMRHWIALWLGLALILGGPLQAKAQIAPLGAWAFEPTDKFPQFTKMVVERHNGQLSGVITSQWYGDLPMLNLRVDRDRLIFQIYNGNPRLTPHDLIARIEGHHLVLTGRVWDDDQNASAHPATPAELETLRFPTFPLPPPRSVPDNGLARTPPMGWSSWNAFGQEIDDQTVRQTADALVATGLRDVGYLYVNIDDGWQGVRDANGVLQPNAKFPDMKALADYVHARGLKLGIYSSPGPKSCAGFPGSYGHVEQDARTWAAWGIDYLKYDLCSGEAFYHTAQTVLAVYQQMGEALQATGRPILYSLCEYGRFDVGSWGRRVGGNLWRTTGDITDDYARMSAIGFDMNGAPHNGGPGGWNDPDMLEVGNGGMTLDEYRTHMSLWALMAAPLLLGDDVRSVQPDILSLLKNRDVIAIDQDRLGRQGLPLRRVGDVEIWTRPLADGALAVGVFNRSARPTTVTLDWAELGLKPPRSLRDVWRAIDLDAAQAKVTREIAAHGVVLLRLGRGTP
jgi:alpha-galactosidase